MLRRTLLAIALASTTAALHVACGGSIGSGNATTNGDGGADGGGGDGSIGGTIEGSYDLTFASVVVAMPSQIGGDVKPPSLSHAVRLDIRKRGDGGYDAVFTTRWGQSTALTVDVAADALTIRGQGNVAGNDSFYVTDTYKTLTFARAADGALTGAFTAIGEENMTGGDVVYSSPITATGAMVRDATTPELRATLSSTEGPDDMLLPWDPIRVSFAEPVDESAVVNAFHLKSKSGDDVAIAWKKNEDPDSAPTAWAGTTSASGTIAAWGDVLASPLALAATPTIPDLVGRMTAPYASSPSFMPLELHQAQHGFDSDVVTVGSWGSPLFLGGKSGSDPSCEHGGCVEIGPFQNGVCGAARVGIAGIIESGSAARVVVRYRVLLKDNGSMQAPQSYGSAFAIDAARPGAAVQTTQTAAMPADVKHLASAILGMEWGTDWTTAKATIPAGASQLVGFTVRAGAYPGPQSCAGGPVPQPIETIVLVDSVTVE